MNAAEVAKLLESAQEQMAPGRKYVVGAIHKGGCPAAEVVGPGGQVCGFAACTCAVVHTVTPAGRVRRAR
jgi:hypothetical protein